MSYSEVKRLPVRYRKWFLERLAKHFKQINESRGVSDINEPKPLSDEGYQKFEALVGKKLSKN
jgi:hypothetical protein